MVAWPGKSGAKVARCGQCITPGGWGRLAASVAGGRAALRLGACTNRAQAGHEPRFLLSNVVISSADQLDRGRRSAPSFFFYVYVVYVRPRLALHPRHDGIPQRHRFASRPSPPALVVRPRRPCPGAGSRRLSARPRAGTRSRGARRTDRRDRGLSRSRGPGVSRSRWPHRSDADAAGRRRARVRVSHLRFAPLLQCHVSGHGPWSRRSGTRR